MSNNIILEKIKRPLKDLINLLITGQYEEIFRRGYDDSDVPFPGYLEEAMSQSYRIIGRLREELPDKPEGLYQFTVPPEEVIDKAILDASLCRGSNTDFNLSDDLEDVPTLKEVIDRLDRMPDSTWSIWVDMWAVGGETQLSLLVYSEFASNEVKIKIDQLGVM